MRGVFLLGCLCLATRIAAADSPEVTLKVGEAAPEFEARTATGDMWRSDEHVGKSCIVVYFYPADLTNGCTTQACGFRDHLKELDEAGVQIVGISGDSPKNHELFTRVHELNFPLLADEDGKIARTFGVPVREGDTITRMVDGVEQTLSRGITASRWTFIIGKDGKVVHRDTAVEAAEDCRNVLKIVRRLTADSE